MRHGASEAVPHEGGECNHTQLTVECATSDELSNALGYRPQVSSFETFMVNLPLLSSFDVTEYGLYPGDGSDTPGLHVRFAPGLTLVLGANGLGKTTLVTMLYRLLTGPFDIPILMRNSDLGNANLRGTSLAPRYRRAFAQRVADNAGRASARLVFELDGEELTVERNLRDLTLSAFAIGKSVLSGGEEQYRDEIVRLANVSTFGDWILLLRYIVFYFEDRRSLVWDPSAQRQLLRILFLAPDESQHWTEREREILELDTRMRNMRAVATAEEKSLAVDDSLAASVPEVREQLRDLERHQRIAEESLGAINSKLPDIEALYEGTNHRYLTLEQERESTYREFERAQLLALNARLPQHSDSARYILAQILSEAECLVCGNNVPDFMDAMLSRIRGNECVVCGSGIKEVGNQTPVELAEQRINYHGGQLHSIDASLAGARTVLKEAEDDRNQAVAEISKLRSEIAQNSAHIEMLLNRVPPGEAELYERRQELASLRGRVELLRNELSEKQDSFVEIITTANANVVERAWGVQKYFANYASEFLFEDCQLVWSPRSERLGQTGQRFNFPAFELDLGGSNFSGTLRRSGPDDVSESQREFIDLAFRMALVKVATSQQTTSLVMDAPEASLDAVFVDRAAHVLGRFGRRHLGNRLVITSNLVDGNLIPALLKEAADVDDRAHRVVDLLNIASPTAALLSLRSEYDEVRDRILEEARALE